MIQSIFSSLELAPLHSTIVTRGLSIHLLMKSVFLLSRGLLCLYDKQNNTWLLVDMEFFFSWSIRHLTRSLRSLVSYRVKHSKGNSISKRFTWNYLTSRSDREVTCESLERKRWNKSRIMAFFSFRVTVSIKLDLYDACTEILAIILFRCVISKIVVSLDAETMELSWKRSRPGFKLSLMYILIILLQWAENNVSILKLCVDSLKYVYYVCFSGKLWTKSTLKSILRFYWVCAVKRGWCPATSALYQFWKKKTTTKQ